MHFLPYDRLKAFQPRNIELFLERFSDTLTWTEPITTIKWLLIYIVFVYYIQLWWIPVILIMILLIGKYEPQFFTIGPLTTERARRQSSSMKLIADEEEKKSSYIYDSQIYIEKVCGLMEKIYHIYSWERDEITFSLVLILLASKKFQKH